MIMVKTKREIYRRAEYTIPQLDGTYNASDSSDIDSHDYLDIANIDITQHNTRGQKKRQKAAEAKIANMHLANIEIIKPILEVESKDKRYQRMKLLIWTK